VMAGGVVAAMQCEHFRLWRRQALAMALALALRSLLFG